MSSKDIVPGESVGKFKLGMSLAEVEFLLPFHRKEINSRFVVWTKQMGIWIDKDILEVTQIAIQNGYPGKVLGKVGLGETLLDVEKHFGNVEEELDVYIPTSIDGVCFQLEDNDVDEEWDERTAPIEYISIFPITRVTIKN